MPDFVYFVHPPRETFPGDATPEELAVVAEHFAYLQAKLASGELVLVGRTQDEPPIGIAIFEAADVAGAEKFFREDPAVAKGVFRGEVRPYHIALMRGRE